MVQTHQRVGMLNGDRELHARGRFHIKKLHHNSQAIDGYFRYMSAKESPSTNEKGSKPTVETAATGFDDALDRPVSSSKALQRATLVRPHLTPRDVLQLQSTVGNRATTRLFKANVTTNYPTASPTHIPHSADQLQRFEGNEHKSMGDIGSGNGKLKLPGGLEVTFGDITAMAGDYFGSVPQIQALAAKKGNGKTPGTSDEIEFVLYVKIRKSKKAKDFGKKVADAVDSRYYGLAGTNVTHFTEPDEGDENLWFGRLADKKRTVSKDVAGDYGVSKGAKVPVNNAGSYRANHMAAIQAAVIAGAQGKSNDEALLYEAFSSHFLTDAYAGGHLRTPRSAIKAWWDPKLPMFWTNLKLWMAERIAHHMNDNSIAGGLTVQILYEQAQATIEKAAKKLPALTFGDAIAGAVHDMDNEAGVMAQIGNEVVKLVGDGQVLDSKNRALVKGAETATKAAAGVKVSLTEVETAYKMGKSGADLAAVLSKLRLPNGLFRAEQLWPRALSDANPLQTNPSLEWKKKSHEDLFKDPIFRKALVHFSHEKADTLGGAVELEAPLKADKEVALRDGVLKVLKSNETVVINAFSEIINYTPGSATGQTGGVFSHDEDDDALSYYRKAKKKKALHTLTLPQRTRLVRLVLSGATVGAEDSMIVDLLRTKYAHVPAVINAVSWRWIWNDISGNDLKNFVDKVGPVYWRSQPFAAKKREVKFLADGWTSDISQRLIIVILKSCSGPEQVKAISRHAGGLDSDLSGEYQKAFDKLKK